MAQVGIFPWSRPMPHDHSSIPQGGLIASILASITDPAHDHSSVAEGGIFPDLWLGASPLIRQASGEATFQTNEGVNTNSILAIKGKGSGYGNLKIYDNDDAEYLLLRCSSGQGQIQVQGISPIELQIQLTNPQPVSIWGAIASGNPTLKIYGYETAVGLKYGQFYVDADGILNIEAEDGDVIIKDNLTTEALKVVGNGAIHPNVLLYEGVTQRGTFWYDRTNHYILISTVSEDADIYLLPHAAGKVRFGTHAAIGAETVTGYITIKDGGGNLRKLAVVS